MSRRVTRGKILPEEIEFRETCAAYPEQHDAFVEDSQVGYLRLSGGQFTVDVPDIDGVRVFFAEPVGADRFEEFERATFLSAARVAIAKYYNSGEIATIRLHPKLTLDEIREHYSELSAKERDFQSTVLSMQSRTPPITFDLAFMKKLRDEQPVLVATLHPSPRGFIKPRGQHPPTTLWTKDGKWFLTYRSDPRYMEILTTEDFLISVDQVSVPVKPDSGPMGPAGSNRIPLSTPEAVALIQHMNIPVPFMLRGSLAESLQLLSLLDALQKAAKAKDDDA